MYGKLYDTSFSPQDPAIAHRERGLDLEVENQSPVATLRLLNRLLPDEYLKLMQVGRAVVSAHSLGVSCLRVLRCRERACALCRPHGRQ